VGLLQEHSLLPDKGRLVTDRLVRPAEVYQGLCIDDFFALSPVPAEDLGQPTAPKSKAYHVFRQAKQCYEDANLAGSDPKDVVDADCGVVVGAEVDSRASTVAGGILPVGCPASKRLALSWIAAKAAALPCTSDALHASLLGGLVSAFCFRRCSMAVLEELFKVIPATELQPDQPRTHPLSRRAANELILSAVLLPVATSDILAPFHKWIYASDASNAKGAFCESIISPGLAMPLWQAGDFKGGHSFLDPWQKRVVQEASGWDEEDWHDLGAAETDQKLPLSRPLAQFFDFIEICGGAGAISEEMSSLGYTVGPIIDITYSKQYNLVDLRTLEWLLFLVQNRRVRALALEPPCTTFSAAAHPACRSYRVPRGWNQKVPKVWYGNRLAFACLTLMLAAAHAYVIALMETPRRSKMGWLREWLFLLSLPNVEETFTASCSFGSEFQKEFKFLTCNMRAKSICRPCKRDHTHVRVQGQLTKGSAVYCKGLAVALADLFHRHLKAEADFSAKHRVNFEGLESIFVNEVIKKQQWSVGSFWKWTGSSHINVLEMASVVQALKRAARRGGGRICLLVDSYVVMRSVAKGRSSSKALAPLLRKIMAISLAFGIFISIHFVPTRLNVADDPTRSCPLRESISRPSCLNDLDQEGLFRLAELPRMKRWISNWTSLFLGLCSVHSLRYASLSIPHPRTRSSSPPVDFYHHVLDFDATLGFPGEGPLGVVGFCLGLVVFGLLVSYSHGMNPRHRDDERRAAARSVKPLHSGRPVQPLTRSNRDKLLENFGAWLMSKGISLTELLEKSYTNPEGVVSKLVEYGLALYDSGRPYSHFSETINAVAAARPTIRRMLTGAWDLAFSWLREEPGEHHTACPFQIFLGLISACILWGWPTIAGILALSWGAVCRIGEVLQAHRRDLVLPPDVGYTSSSVFLRVQEPKTRYRAARHQVARLDYADLVDLVTSAFAGLKPEERLWPFSAQLLRTRFKQLLRGIGLPHQRSESSRCLDLGSLRAGGATFLMMISEDAELVRRRGRWLAPRTMEIYVQEVGATIYFPHLSSDLKEPILAMASSFPALLESMKNLQRIHVPPSAWYKLFQMQTDGKDGMNGLREKAHGKNAPCSRTKPKDMQRKKAEEQLTVAATSTLTHSAQAAQTRPPLG